MDKLVLASLLLGNQRLQAPPSEPERAAVTGGGGAGRKGRGGGTEKEGGRLIEVEGRRGPRVKTLSAVVSRELMALQRRRRSRVSNEPVAPGLT